MKELFCAHFGLFALLLSDLFKEGLPLSLVGEVAKGTLLLRGAEGQEDIGEL